MKYVKIKIPAEVTRREYSEQKNYIDRRFHENKHKAKEIQNGDSQSKWIWAVSVIAFVEVAVAIPAVVMLLR